MPQIPHLFTALWPDQWLGVLGRTMRRFYHALLEKLHGVRRLSSASLEQYGCRVSALIWNLGTNRDDCILQPESVVPPPLHHRS